MHSLQIPLAQFPFGVASAIDEKDSLDRFRAGVANALAAVAEAPGRVASLREDAAELARAAGGRGDVIAAMLHEAREWLLADETSLMWASLSG